MCTSFVQCSGSLEVRLHNAVGTCFEQLCAAIAYSGQLLGGQKSVHLRRGVQVQRGQRFTVEHPAQSSLQAGDPEKESGLKLLLHISQVSGAKVF